MKAFTLVIVTFLLIANNLYSQNFTDSNRRGAAGDLYKEIRKLSEDFNNQRTSVLKSQWETYKPKLINKIRKRAEKGESSLTLDRTDAKADKFAVFWGYARNDQDLKGFVFRFARINGIDTEFVVDWRMPLRNIIETPNPPTTP